MIDINAGVWLLPTRNRLDNVRRFLSAAREMGCSSSGWILVNEDELEANKAAYEALKPYAPGPKWQIIGVKADSYGAALRAVWPKVKDMQWVGLVSDDLVPCSSGWDVSLINSLQGWNMVSSGDGWQCQSADINKSRMHGATAFSGDLLREIGWLFPPKLKHIFHDDIMEAVGRETNCWQIRVDILVKHLHEALEGVRGPTMDPNSLLWQHDEAIYKEWVAAEKEATVARVKGLMTRYGVKTMKADYAGVSLMIATPSIDGRYEGNYVISLFQTMEMLKQQGVPSQWSEERYTADIALARSKLLAAFRRSSCSHLLMVDADMDWEPQAVARLFCAKADLVAVAGPKKRYPLSFAANYTDDFGSPLNLQYDAENGTMEVSEIGAAFVLLTRNCVERMCAAYPELEYFGLTGEKEHLLFAPQVWNKRIMSEDWSFMRRWRAIGGKVLMAPDISLGHTGHHTFRGSFKDAIESQHREREMQKGAAA